MIHHVEVQVLILLLIASIVGMGARRIRVPYTLALVLAGLALGFLQVDALADLSLTPELLLLLFLPPLLFEAAYHLPFEDLRKNAVHVGSLAVVGVVVSVGLTAGALYAVIHGTGLWASFTWMHALLFASVIVATDPISVLALFKELGAPKRLYQVVEGESLVNDGVAVVVFAIIAAVYGLQTAHGAHVELNGAQDVVVYAISTFVRTGFGGVMVGAGAGALASVLTRQVDDHLIEITLTTLLAWGSFLIAEELHVSGVLSTVAAGVTMGSFGKHYGMSASTRIAVQDFWQYMGFLSNSFIFLLIGLQLEPDHLWVHAAIVAAGFVSVVFARAVVVYGGLPIIDRFTEPLPKAWRHILAWGGLRGSLSMVLILGLPADFPEREVMIHLVFGVVAISLFLQGLTMAPLMRFLGLSGSGAFAVGPEYERERGQAIAFGQVLHAADELREQHLMDVPTHARLRAHYERAQQAAQGKARELAGDSARPERLVEGLRALALVERESITHAEHSGIISSDTAALLQRGIDARMDELDQAAHEGEEALVELLNDKYPRPQNNDSAG